MSAAPIPVVLALDLGGSSFKAALIDQRGGFRHEDKSPTLGLAGEAAMDCLLELGARMRAVALDRDLSLTAAGVIAPGMNEEAGRIMFAANLGWSDVPIRARLEQHLGVPVAVGHDVRTAGLAEARLGAGRGLSDFALVMIGTGIAAAFVTRGAVITGATGTGGEFGHMPVVPFGESCACGQRGCLETYASAASIARRYKARGGAPMLGAADIVAAQNGDALARQVWAEAIEMLSFGLASVTMLMDPALIVLGGGLAEAGDGLLVPLRAALEARLAWRPPPPLCRSRLGLEAGRLGAALLAYRALGLLDVVDEWPIPDIAAE